MTRRFPQNSSFVFSRLLLNKEVSLTAVNRIDVAVFQEQQVELT